MPAGVRVEMPATGILAQPGETVIVQGRSGSGIFFSLQHISDCADDVLLDRRPSRELPVRAVVLVAADEPLFCGTVAENLRLGRTDLDDADMRRLLDDAGLGELTPDTAVGHGGRAMSGGEVRRLAVLRALVARPRLLLLDDRPRVLTHPPPNECWPEYEYPPRHRDHRDTRPPPLRTLPVPRIVWSRCRSPNQTIPATASSPTGPPATR